jgi:DNA-directed RNA polymerase specialized sigma24 family protein
MNSLDPNEREAVSLAFVEGLTTEEIADKTGEKPKAVVNHLCKGLIKLCREIIDAKELRLKFEREIGLYTTQ